MSSPIENWRLFVAIELPEQTRQAIAKHIDELRAQVPDARASWIREENLHLTIKFLGDVLVGEVEKVSAAAARAAYSADPFELIVSGCGAFPTRGQPKVLWIGTEDSAGDLLLLHSALETECETVGFPREPRSFHPHLTIARLRQPQGARELAKKHQEADFKPLTVRVAEICVMRSELSSKGSRYTTISRHQFR